MPKQIKLKTKPTSVNVREYINTLNASEKKDAHTLLKLFKDTTNVTPTMWGESIVGFGSYEYKRSNGDTGDFLATGFSIRKSGPTIYIMPGYEAYTALLEKLGPHKLGKSCLYLKSLEGIDQKVLAKLITSGLRDLKKTHRVSMH